MGGSVIAVSVVAAPVSAAGKISFYSRVKAELQKLFTHAPGWEASAAATLTYVAPMVETLVTLVDPAVAPIVNGVIVKAQSAMAAAAVVIKDAGPAPTLMTYLKAVNSDMAEVESAAQIKDPATAAKLTALVGTITGEIEAILGELAEVGATA